ncbi:hypothetical protein GGU11DRAFT_761574, partial [Lentinula aff. detonsa]
ILTARSWMIQKNFLGEIPIMGGKLGFPSNMGFPSWVVSWDSQVTWDSHHGWWVTEVEENRVKSVGALVRDLITRKEEEKKKKKESCSSPDDSIIIVGQKRKRIAMIPTSSGDPDDSDDGFEPEDGDEDDDDEGPSPTPSPQKSSKCNRCTTKEILCTLIGEGSTLCHACRKAKVKCSLVGNERVVRRSKRVKREESKREETPVASSSSRRIDALKESNQELSRWLFLMEDMVRFIVQMIRPIDANEETEEDQVKRTGDVKGKGRKE